MRTYIPAPVQPSFVYGAPAHHAGAAAAGTGVLREAGRNSNACQFHQGAVKELKRQ